ncbi:MAG TPA: type IV pilin N-terminal domain-containing protein, partial [Methanomassiliicoccales archaeon]|nr:type IV pilin N-terminal domain-containing protein [Methanomassiliicoccales archaeon]
MSKFNKKLSKSRSGVSDIIGNLLILAITVSLFSTVLFFVTSMPAPVEATFTDLEPSISADIDGVLISVTHKGGQTLNNWSTGIYIFVNGAYTGELYIASGGIADEKWETGDVWVYNQSYNGTLDSLSMLVVDKNSNSIVWQSDLIGGASDIALPPIIGNRWTVPMIGTKNKPLTFHITIIDPNDDLDYSSARLDASYLNGVSNVPLIYNGGNMFSAVLTPTVVSEEGTTVIITASDLAGNTGRALMSVVVYDS